MPLSVSAPMHEAVREIIAIDQCLLFLGVPPYPNLFPFVTILYFLALGCFNIIQSQA